VITPRRTRLIRVHDLRGFRAAVAELAGRTSASGTSSLDRTHASSTAIVVPTRSAANQLGAGVTRDELYDLLYARLADPPRRLTAIERDIIAQAAARAASADADLNFRLRPGLVSEMLRFYDHLRRQSQQVKRFEELLNGALGSDEIDRGARRMRAQTRFLADAFREYERRTRESGALDEHLLRERLVAEAAREPLRHAVVTVADWIADPDGLFVADYDLLSRIPGLETLDIVATESLLGSGFHERLHTWLPGIDEVGSPKGKTATVEVRSRSVLMTPPGAASDEPWWTCRDREEELVAIARQLKADRRAGEAVPLERVAVVYKNPLPYVYLASEVFGSAGIPFQTSDALPLAAEPTSAAVDLVLEAVDANFSREALVALMRSPHFEFGAENAPVDVPRAGWLYAVNSLDHELSDRRYLGDLARLEALEADWDDTSSSAAVRLASAIGRQLAPLASPAPASQQARLLQTFWTRHRRPLDESAPWADRERRARAALDATLEALATFHQAHDDPDWTIRDLALALRRWIEDQTFDVDRRASGVHLIDDKAARYGDFDDVWVVGLVDPEWPERPRRNIFYPPALLKSLGWPSEKDRRAAADARFLDLVSSPSRRTSLFTFTLEDDALVSRSMQLDEIPRARMSSVARAPDAASRVFVDEALSLEPVVAGAVARGAQPWAALRSARTGTDAPQFHGTAGPPPARPWSVSAIETYLGCPFRFFAQYVLKLEEEPDDEEVMDPRRQGQLVHEVFERFFIAWQDAGHGAITPGNLESARAMFAAVVDGALAQLPDAEAGLERTRLLGSPAAAGLGEAVMRMEAERPVPVVERLLEYTLVGSFTFASPGGPRPLALRGKADRLDLLADGTFRLVDYKLGWPPDKSTALQLPIYAACAEQRLDGRHGRRWTLGEAAYIAFKGPKRIVPLFKNDAERDEVLTRAQHRLVETIDLIAGGHFPPTPDDVFRCETCSYASVCRKDYVGDV
jgi:RecB family exonuclease